MRIHIDRDVCVSAGNCVMTAGAVFDQDDEGIVMLLVDEVPPAEEENAREAVGLCPSKALRIAE